MKQILQNLGNGETLLADVPCPYRSKGFILGQTTASLVSLGTEKMLIEFGQSGLIAKARSQPDKVKQVFQKIKTDGLWATLEAVKAKLDTPIPLGYCNVGRVFEADAHSKFAVGDRVVSNGPHAEIITVPENLVAKIPGNVPDEVAAFTVVGAIGLQGIRLLAPTLGEKIVVSGLGLIGLLTVQMLRAHGCQVLGIDFDARKIELARRFGAQVVDLSAGQDPVRIAEQWASAQGVDGVIITASTKSDKLIHQAATMCRKRGRIILVGVIGLNLQRADFYEKEISFQVSCSYGPGRYDDNYEKRGIDYPIGFVRWTEQRNFEAVLDLMADGKIDVGPLITHRFDFDDALEGYQAVGEEGALGVLLDYPDQGPPQKVSSRINIIDQKISRAEGVIGVGFIGAGGFTTRMLLPLLPAKNVFKKLIVSNSGVSAAHAGEKFGFKEAASDSDIVMNDPEVDAVFITTPHNSHSTLVNQALKSGMHVFVEKPLAMNNDELELVMETARSHPRQLLMVGFNRRFSPHMTSMYSWLKAAPSSKSIVITVNAGAIPSNHWTQDRSIGGGRIIGECCHFIDLARYLASSSIVETVAFPMSTGDGVLGDCVSIQLSFADGSIATIHYFANGNRRFPKERIEVFAGGKVFVCDNFRVTREVGGRRKVKTRAQDKGHSNELEAFFDSIQSGGRQLISNEELFEVSHAAIDADAQVRMKIASRLT